MIIARMYERLGRLIERDPKAKKIIMNAFKKTELKGNKQEIRRILEYNYHNSVYKAEYGCGIPHIGDIEAGFRNLDESDPYDNGYEYGDVKSMQILNQEHKYVKMALLSDMGDIIEVIEMGEHQKSIFAFEFSWLSQQESRGMTCVYDDNASALIYVVDGEEGKIHLGGRFMTFMYELMETGIEQWNHNEYLTLSTRSGDEWKLFVDTKVKFIRATGRNAYPGDWQKFLQFLHRWGMPASVIEG